MVTKQQSPIFVTLQSIQQSLVAPKGQYNSFGKYSYRSAEDILEALKPILQEHDAVLILQDGIVQIGDRYYVEATATLYAVGETIGTTAYAREDDSKKGMDGSQVTGAASSYARKYALNGLFMIDDNKDPDTDEYHNQNSQAGRTSQKPAQKTNSQQKQPANAPAKSNGAKTITEHRLKPFGQNSKIWLRLQGVLLQQLENGSSIKWVLTNLKAFQLID